MMIIVVRYTSDGILRISSFLVFLVEVVDACVSVACVLSRLIKNQDFTSFDHNTIGVESLVAVAVISSEASTTEPSDDCRIMGEALSDEMSSFIRTIALNLEQSHGASIVVIK